MTFPPSRSHLTRLLMTGLAALSLAGTNQAAADTIAVSGSLAVTFTAVGPGQVTSLPVLTYSTTGPVTTPGSTKRAVTVRLLEPLPPGVTVTVKFTPDVGRGTSMGPLTLSMDPQILVDLIDDDVTQSPKTLTYTVTTTQGFVGLNLQVEVELVDR